MYFIQSQKIITNQKFPPLLIYVVGFALFIEFIVYNLIIKAANEASAHTI